MPRKCAAIYYRECHFQASERFCSVRLGLYWSLLLSFSSFKTSILPPNFRKSSSGWRLGTLENVGAQTWNTFISSWYVALTSEQHYVGEKIGKRDSEMQLQYHFVHSLSPFLSFSRSLSTCRFNFSFLVTAPDNMSEPAAPRSRLITFPSSTPSAMPSLKAVWSHLIISFHFFLTLNYLLVSRTRSSWYSRFLSVLSAFVALLVFSSGFYSWDQLNKLLYVAATICTTGPAWWQALCLHDMSQGLARSLDGLALALSE